LHFTNASELARGQWAEPHAGIALAEFARGRLPEAATALAHATKLDPRYASPEALIPSGALTAHQAQILTLIARHTRQP